jgi:hypothetical protein
VFDKFKNENKKSHASVPLREQAREETEKKERGKKDGEMPFLFWLSSPFCSALVVLSLQSCAGSPIRAALSWQHCPGSCPRSPVMEVSFCLSHSVCPFLAFLSFSGCQILSGQSHPACLVLPVLFCLSCSACPVLSVLFCLSCSAYPVLPVLLCLSCSACPVLLIPLCLSYSACPVLPVLFCLSCSACPVLPVLFCLAILFCPSCFCLSCPDFPVLAVLSWLSCHRSLVLRVAFWLSFTSCPILAGSPVTVL